MINVDLYCKLNKCIQLWKSSHCTLCSPVKNQLSHDSVACRTSFSSNNVVIRKMIWPFFCRFAAWDQASVIWASFSQVLVVKQINRSPTPYSRIVWYTREFMVNSVTARWPGPVAGKTSPKHHPSTSMLIVGMRYLCWYSVLGFHQMWSCDTWAGISTLIASVGRPSFQMFCCLFRCNSANPKL